MSLHTHLENIRSKPEHIRKRFAFWTSFVFTSLIFVFWLASFTTSMATPRNAVTAAVAQAGPPGQSLLAGVGSFFTDIKEIFFGTKKVTYKEIEVSPGKK